MTFSKFSMLASSKLVQRPLLSLCNLLQMWWMKGKKWWWWASMEVLLHGSLEASLSLGLGKKMKMEWRKVKNFVGLPWKKRQRGVFIVRVSLGTNLGLKRQVCPFQGHGEWLRRVVHSPWSVAMDIMKFGQRLRRVGEVSEFSRHGYSPWTLVEFSASHTSHSNMHNFL